MDEGWQVLECANYTQLLQTSAQTPQVDDVLSGRGGRQAGGMLSLIHAFTLELPQQHMQIGHSGRIHTVTISLLKIKRHASLRIVSLKCQDSRHPNKLCASQMVAVKTWASTERPCTHHDKMTGDIENHENHANWEIY